MGGLPRPSFGSRGSTAVEFALVAPVLVTMMVGVFEGMELYRAQMKVAHAAGLLVRMVAQQAVPVSGGTQGTLGNLCTGAELSMMPLATGSFASAIASVTTSQNGSGTTTAKDWESDTSCTTPGTALNATAVSFATAHGLVPNAGDSVIIVNASYVYKAPTSLVFGSQYNLTSMSYARPRINSTIACTNSPSVDC